MEHVLRGLVAAAPDALLAVDPAGRIVYANDQTERIFGWSRAELVGQLVECLVPVGVTTTHPALRAAFAGHPENRPMGATLELWARRRDGSEFPVEISLSGFDTAEGPLVAAAIRDVTTARRAKHRLRAVLASAPDAIVGVDESGRIELLNAQTARMFGWTAVELVARQVETLLPRLVLADHVRGRSGRIGNPESRPMESGLQLSAQRKDGTTFPVEISLSAMSDEPGSPLVLAAIRDVTERTEFAAERQRQALEAQSEQSHRLESLGQLAGGVAHDFNNLLGVILNYTALLSRRLSDPTATADLGEIRAAAERAAGLTRQLLTFARRDVANPEPIEVNNVVQEIASMLERTLGEQIELRLDLAVGPLIAMVDKQQLDQVVMNLAINSRDAMAGGGTLTIATARSPAGSGRVGDVVLRVIDTGAGMAPEVRARAFEPFFTTKPHGQGTGLGLATVYGVVRQNDGDITIDSGVGVGTTVSVVLRAARGATPACGYPTEAAEGGTERILLVEDEVGLRVGTARILAEQGYEVLVASDGIEALEVFDGEDGMIDIVLSDVVMPRMRGDDLARILADRAPGIPVILLSGYDSDARVTGPLLPKPVGEAVLLRAIREALDV